MLKKNYIIWAESLITTKGNGTRSLYNLAKALEEKGYNAYIYSPKPWAPGYKYISKITNEMKKNDIFIYTEGVKGNPFKARNIVRYILFFPGVFGDDTVFHHSDNIFTWNAKFYPGAPILFIPYLDQSLFYNDNSPKTQDCYFVHKKGKFREVKEIEGLLEINMKFPSNRETLAKILRTTGTLYTFDDHSAIINEAHACGANVKVITKNDIVDATDFDYFDYNVFEKQLEYFIEFTQALDYKGDLQHVKIPLKHKFKIYYYRALNNKKKLAKYRRKYGFIHFEL